MFSSRFDIPYCQNDIPITISSIYGVAMSPKQFSTVNYKGETQYSKFMWDIFTEDAQKILSK